MRIRTLMRRKKMTQQEPERTRGTKSVLWVSFAAGLTLVLVAYAVALKQWPAFDATYSYLACPFQRIWNIDCCGCGGQRAISHLLNGNFALAFQSNAYVVAILLPYSAFQVGYFWLVVLVPRRKLLTCNGPILPFFERACLAFVLISGMTFMIVRNIVNAAPERQQTHAPIKLVAH